MTNRRDIELLISARDNTGRTFQQVAQEVSHLSSVLAEQALAASRGEVTLEALERTQKALAAAGADLVQKQNLIDLFNRQAAAVAEAEAKAAKLKAEYEALKGTLDSAGAATAAQEKKLASLEKQSRSAAQAAEQQRSSLAETTASMSQAGIATDKLDHTQDQLVQSAKQVGVNLSAVGGLIDSYANDVRAAATAEQQAAGAKGLAGKAQDAAALKQAADYTRFWAQALDEAAVAESRLSSLTAFRKVGQDALEASRDITQFTNAARGMPVATNELAQGLFKILEPGQAAIQTLDGLEAAVTQAGAVTDGEKHRISEYSNALNELSRIQAEIMRQGAAIDTFKNQAAVVAAAKKEFDEAAAKVEHYARAVASADEPNKELTNSLKQAEAAFERTGQKLVQEETKLGELSGTLKKAGVDTNNLTAAEKRLEEQATKTASSTKNINETLGRNGGKAGGLFGLNPYELQNLGFQLNDVFTQLASGTPIFQVLAQQGGQITQIFPGAIGFIARYALVWGPVAAAIGLVVAITKEMISDVERVKEFTKALSVDVDGGLYDPEKLAAIAEGLEMAGVSAEDAKKAVMEFVNSGTDADQIQMLVDTAKNMAEVLGIEVPEAASQLNDILNGGYDAVVKLDDSMNVLTASEREHARALFESGKAAEARQYVFDRVRDKMDDIAARSRGPWKTGVENLKNAWNNFVGWLERVHAFDDIKMKINSLAASWVFLTSLMKGNGFTQATKDMNAAMAASQKVKAAGPAGNGGERQRQAKADADYIADLKEQTVDMKHLTKAERVRLAGLKELRRAQSAGLSDPAARQAQQIAAQREQNKIDDEEARAGAKAERTRNAAARRAEAARKRAARAAETEANRVESMQSQLTNQLRQLDAQAGSGAFATLEDRLAKVDTQYEKIYDTIKKLREHGQTKTADGMDLKDAEALIEAQKNEIKQKETLDYWEDQLKGLTKERAEEISNIADEQERGAIGVAEAFKQTEDINNRLSPQIVAAAQQALTVAEAIAKVKPTPELMAMIATLKGTVAKETSPKKLLTPQADMGKEGLNQQEKLLNDLLADRNALVESYNNLVALGLMTDKEARENAAAAYNQAAPAIKSQIAAIQQTVELLHQQGLITDIVYQNWLAKIQAVNAGTQFVDTRIQQINETAQQAIAQGITSAFDTAAKAIVGLVSGTMSFGDAIESIGRTALQFVADFTQALAQALIQMLALAAAKQLIGASSGGLGSLFFHSGGVVGGGSGRWSSNRVPAAAFLGAPRLHSGGGLGLKSDEYAAVLQRGEEVLTSDNPRHINNAGKGGPGAAPAPALRQVLVFKDEEIAGAMSGAAGERTFMTFLRRNATTVKQILR